MALAQAIDTHQLVENLIHAGLQKVIAEEITKNQLAVYHNLVTSDQLSVSVTELKCEIQGLRAELKSEIQEVRTELKSEIQGLRAELKSEIQEVRTELKSEIQELRTDIKVIAGGLRNLQYTIGFAITVASIITAIKW